MTKIINNEILQNQFKLDFTCQLNKVMTPYDKLCKRLNKEFVKKKLIGDIFINDFEYKLLINDFKSKFKTLTESYLHKIIDIPLAVTLVQIGVRYYDGRYWPHVSSELGIDIHGYQQGWIGDSFVDTLKKYDKITLSSHEKVNSILMHSFISDYYAKDFFDFLFNYYRIDLDRDVSRINSSNMNLLIETMIKNDNRNRTYLLKQQTADAINKNIRGSKIRVRRFLKLIDKCFWDDSQIITGNHRLTSLFNSWRIESSNFQLEYKKYHIGIMNKKGKKCFISPYLSADLRNLIFRLILPPQLIKSSDESNDIYWSIKIGEHVICEQTNYYEAVTGFKTLETSIGIANEDLFKTINIELINNSERIAVYKDIKADCVRFFDEDGDLLPANNLPSGKVYAYTDKLSYISSPGLVTNETYNEFNVFYFEFQTGDIVRLPDGTVISIGKEIIEGLSLRSSKKDSYVKIEEGTLPLYSAPPTVIIKIAKNKVNGTMLMVNEKRMRLFDMSTIEIPLHDRSGEIGYLFNLKDCGCNRDGIYSINIDVPNDKKRRNWSFALINNLSYKFDDSPYIFSSKGTISFSEDSKVKPLDFLNENKGENSYNFEISAIESDLCFTSLRATEITFYINVPVLKWKFDKQDWQIMKPENIWHSSFPKLISFIYPEDSLSLCMNEELDNEDEEEHKITFTKIKDRGIFECDTNRLLSWFSRDQINNTIFIKFHGKRIPFIDVITRSEVLSCLLTADFSKEILNGEFNIIGQAEYYVDILVGDKHICDKVLLTDGMVSIPTKLYSGTYRALIYESEDDGTGFGLSNFYLIKKYEQELANPYNLEGKTIKIAKIKRAENSIFSISPSLNYIIADLKLLNNDNSNIYYGTMLVKSSSYKTLAFINVLIEFYDLKKLQEVYISIFEDGESISFLFDHQLKYLVKYEDNNLPSSVKYRRYQDLYEGGYYFIIEFISKHTVSLYEIEKAASKAINYPSWYSTTE